MSKTAVPYDGTVIPATQSILGVERNLEKIGFTRFGVLREADTRTVVAEIDGITFKWAANIKGIQLSYRNATRRELKPERAERIAWRAVHFGVEAQVKSILCGATSIAQEFGGLALLPGGQTLADRLTEDAHTGKLRSPTLALLEAPKEYP